MKQEKRIEVSLHINNGTRQKLGGKI